MSTWSYNPDPVAQARQRYNSLANPLGGNQLSPFDFNGQTNRDLAINQAGNALSVGQAQASGDSAAAKAQAAHDELFGLARGRVSELRGDSADQMVLNALTQRSGEGAGPYDQRTIDALLTGASGQAQQVQRNDMARLGKTGLQPGDPAYASAMNEIMARRQGSMQQANLGINQQANLANYSARGQALGQLGSFNMARNQQITDSQRYLGGLLASDQYKQPEADPWLGLAQQQFAFQQQQYANQQREQPRQPAAQQGYQQAQQQPQPSYYQQQAPYQNQMQIKQPAQPGPERKVQPYLPPGYGAIPSSAIRQPMNTDPYTYSTGY